MEYVRRELEDKLKKYLARKEIIAIVGARQCGKTTMIKNMLAKKDVQSISFDDRKALELFESDIDSFIEQYVEGNKYLFIDEVQYAKNSGKQLKYIYDNHDTKIIISGSSAPELSIQSAKYLVGRILIFRLFPFSFKEYLRAKDERLLKTFARAEYSTTITKSLNKHLQEFSMYGGYPQVVLSKTTEEKQTVLKNIYNTFLLREIKEILQLSENDKLIRLMKTLSLQTANLLNYKDLSSITGFKYQDLKKHLQILEETYITSRAGAFFTNKRTELVKAPKIYFIDPGFRNVCIDNFTKQRTDTGAINENMIYTELIKQGKEPKYWRTKSGAEVDFILNDNTPIEVKTTLKTAKTGKSILSYIDKYQPKKAYVLSEEYDGKKKRKDTIIQFMPYTKFLVQSRFLGKSE